MSRCCASGGAAAAERASETAEDVHGETAAGRIAAGAHGAAVEGGMAGAEEVATSDLAGNHTRLVEVRLGLNRGLVIGGGAGRVASVVAWSGSVIEESGSVRAAAEGTLEASSSAKAFAGAGWRFAVNRPLTHWKRAAATGDAAAGVDSHPPRFPAAVAAWQALRAVASRGLRGRRHDWFSAVQEAY